MYFIIYLIYGGSGEFYTKQTPFLKAVSLSASIASSGSLSHGPVLRFPPLAAVRPVVHIKINNKNNYN